MKVGKIHWVTLIENQQEGGHGFEIIKVLQLQNITQHNVKSVNVSLRKFVITL